MTAQNCLHGHISGLSVDLGCVFLWRVFAIALIRYIGDTDHLLIAACIEHPNAAGIAGAEGNAVNGATD